MIDRSQINRAPKLGVFVQQQSKETKGGGVDGGVCMASGWKNKIMSCVWAFVEERIEISGMGPSSEEQVVRL